MADLLRSGNKMLNMACPVCNNPTFRNREGTTFCPACNRKIIIADDKDKINQDNKTNKNRISNNKIREKLQPKRHNELLNLLESEIYQKIEMITLKLENETQIQVIETYTKILLDLFDILNRISILIDKK